MLDGLDAIDWSSEDPDTAAIPQLLRSFLEEGTDDEFWDTLDFLENAFSRREGKPTRFAPLAAPFIYELLNDPRTHGRDVLLVALASMIAAAPSQALLGYGVDPLYRAAFGHLPHLEETVRALASGIAVVVRLAASGEPVVRANAIDLLATIGMAEGARATADTALAVLNDIAMHDEDPFLRADALIGLGAVSRAAGRREIPAAIEAAYARTEPLVRDVARCARAYFEPEALSDPLLADLTALAKRRDVRGEGVVDDPEGLFVWNRGRLAEIAIFAIAGSALHDRSRAMAALFDILDHRLSDGRWKPPVLEPVAISHMLCLVNPMIVVAFGAWEGIDPKALADKRLDENQRKLVDRIDRFSLWSCLPHLLWNGDLTRMRHFPEPVERARQAPSGAWQRWLSQG